MKGWEAEAVHDCGGRVWGPLRATQAHRPGMRSDWVGHRGTSPGRLGAMISCSCVRRPPGPDVSTTAASMS